MATVPSELPFELDTTGIAYKLREAGIKACQSVHDQEQHDCLKQTLQVLARYLGECYKDRADEKAIILARRDAMHAQAAKSQHKLHEGEHDEFAKAAGLVGKE